MTFMNVPREATSKGHYTGGFLCVVTAVSGNRTQHTEHNIPGLGSPLAETTGHCAAHLREQGVERTGV
jgi:hypothetical protein